MSQYYSLTLSDQAFISLNFADRMTFKNQYDNMITAIEALSRRGFNSSFTLDKDRLISLSSDKIYRPEDIEIQEFHRFEGATDFEDMSILYGLKTSSGEKGIVIDAFGTYANRELGEFMKKTHFH